MQITYKQVVERAAASDRFDRSKLELVAEMFDMDPADVAFDVAKERGSSFLSALKSEQTAKPPKQRLLNEQQVRAIATEAFWKGRDQDEEGPESDEALAAYIGNLISEHSW
jgi:hypothetical protein